MRPSMIAEKGATRLQKAQKLLKKIRKDLPELGKLDLDQRVAEVIGWEDPEAAKQSEKETYGARRVRSIRMGDAGLSIVEDFIPAAEQFVSQCSTEQEEDPLVVRLRTMERAIAALERRLELVGG